MKGQIRKRGNSWAVIIYTGLSKEGKKQYKWHTVKGGKKQAQAKLVDLLHQVDTGTYATPKGTFGEFTTRWLVEYAIPNLSPRTTEGYQSIYRAHMRSTFGNVALKNVRPDTIQKYYSDLLASGLSTSTVRRHAMLLHRILEHAVKWQLLARNPADAVSPPRNRYTEIHALDETQVGHILREAEGTRFYPLWHLALNTGVRRSELLALRWQDIDLNIAEISISRAMHRLLNHEVVFRGTKTVKSNRTIALSPASCMVLRQHLDNEMSQCVRLGVPFINDRLVFCEWDGRPMIPHTVTQAWRRLTRRLGYQNVRFHDLRHTCATLLLRAGVHPKVVQERLGHSNIGITLDIYSHVSPNMQRDAAAALDAILDTKNSKRIANEEIKVKLDG